MNKIKILSLVFICICFLPLFTHQAFAEETYVCDDIQYTIINKYDVTSILGSIDKKKVVEYSNKNNVLFDIINKKVTCPNNSFSIKKLIPFEKTIGLLKLQNAFISTITKPHYILFIGFALTAIICSIIKYKDIENNFIKALPSLIGTVTIIATVWSLSNLDIYCNKLLNTLINSNGYNTNNVIYVIESKEGDIIYNNKLEHHNSSSKIDFKYNNHSYSIDLKLLDF